MGLDFCRQSSRRALAWSFSFLLEEEEEEEEEEAKEKEKRRGPGSEGAAEEANKKRDRQVVEAMELARNHRRR